ncbi:MAG: T9SS type A sorting domain-containing protein [Clostridia bacterium]|nr:T9SS type A sorting domain-containing protein [Clostridia bacterium]
MQNILLFRIIFAVLLSFPLGAFAQLPTGWEGDTDIVTAPEATIVFEGTYSCSIQVLSGTQANCDLSNLNNLTVTPGASFKVAFHYFTSEHVRLRAAIDWSNGSATYAANYAGPTTTGDWEEFVWEEVVPADATTANVRIRCYDVSGFAAPETQYVDQVTFESPVGTPQEVFNGNFELWPSAQPEPSEYPANFDAQATQQQVDLSWTDAGGSQLPDAYLILARTDLNFVVPQDGTFVPNDYDFSDGTGAANVAFGAQAFSFFDMMPSTTYYFRIYPYTNSGSNTDFKTDGTAPSTSATTGVAEPELIVTAPVAGNNWFAAATYNITWQASNVQGEVLIELTADASTGNPDWEQLATTNANAGTYSWDIPPQQPTGSDYQIRISGVTTTISSLSGIFSILPAPEIYDIVINEIMYNPPVELGNDDYYEFLELYNNDTETVDLTGWTFINGIDFAFPTGTVLLPGEYLVIAKNPDTIMAYYGISDVLGPFENLTGLNNTGELVALGNAAGYVVDEVEYADGAPWPTSPDGDGPSLSLINPNLDNSLPESWEPSIVPYGTPGNPNSSLEPLLVVTYPNGGENLYRGTTYNITWNFAEFAGNIDIELINTAGANEVLAEEIDVTLQSWEWTIPADQIIGTSYYIQISDAATHTLTDMSDAAFSIIDEPEVPAIVINEIMYNPPVELGDDDYYEFLELYNNDNVAVDLTGWTFTSGIDFTFSDGTMLQPDEYLVIAKNPDSIMAYYGISNVTGPFENTSGLNNSGEMVTLGNATGFAVDMVEYSDSDPWPIAPDGNGPSLSLINPDMDNSLPESWQPSIVLYGTPGNPNTSAEPLLVVTYPNGGEYLYRGMTYNITWNYSQFSGDIDIELINTAGNNQILAEDVDGLLQSWEWTIPAGQTIGSSYFIQISDAATQTLTDMSDAAFSIIDQPEIPTLVITEIMYNPPESGTDSLEFIEIYNNGNDEAILTGYSFSSGIEYVFPELVLPAGDFVVMAVNSAAMLGTFGVEALQWTGGALSNSGELIELIDNFGNIVDAVEYDDTSPWDSLADGSGPSLVLCNPDDDNTIATNWLISAEYAAVNAAGDSIFATPGGPCITTTVNELLPAGDFTVFPNPTKEYFYLNAPLQGSWHIELYDLYGKRVLETHISQSQIIRFKVDLASGMYVIKATHYQSNTTFTEKLIIEK